MNSAEKIADKGLELAMAGDKQMIRFFLVKMLSPPQDGVIEVQIPSLETPANCREAARLVTEAGARGRVTLHEARQLVAMIEQQAQRLRRLSDEENFEERRARLVLSQLLARHPAGESDAEDEVRLNDAWAELLKADLPRKFHDRVWFGYCETLERAKILRASRDGGEA